MGMLMYEDMKVSVLQLLLVRKTFTSGGGFFSSFPHILILRVLCGGKETYCPWRKVV